MKEDEFSDLFDVGGSQSEVKDEGLSPEVIALLNKSKIEANKAIQSQEEENEVPESFEEDEPEEVAEVSIDKSVKPFDFGQKQDSNLTNLDFLSRMLYRDLRGYLRQNYKWLSRKFSKELLETFMEICHKISDNDVETSLLEIVLKDMGIIDIRKDIILKNYDLIRQDESKVICKSTYEKFREIVSREYIERTIVPSDAVKSLERLQNSDFFLPPFGVIESDTFKQCVFGDFDMSTIMEDLGAPLVSNFEPLNEISPIGGYLPGQVTMVSGPPGAQTGDTKVMTLDHGWKTLEELYNSQAEDIEVYCLDDAGNIHVSVAEKCVLTKYTDDIVEIELKGGTKLHATPEHWYRTIEGEWWEACQLKAGMSLTPFHRKVQKNKQQLIRGRGAHDGPDYEACYTYIDRGKDNSYTHRMVKEYLDPSDEYSYVHHNKLKEDGTGFDSLNNEFENLVMCKTWSEHSKIHCKHDRYKSQVLAAGLNTRFDSERTTRLNAGDKSQNRKFSALKMIHWAIEKGYVTGPNDLNEENFNKFRDIYKFERGNYRFPTYGKVMHYFDSDLNLIYNEALSYSNYDIVSVRRLKLEKPIPVYDLLNVDVYRNFAVLMETIDGVDCGVISHNCFVGSTKVRTSEGLETIHNLYLKHTPPSVLYTDMDKHTVDWSWENKGARKIGEGTKFTKVFVSTQPEFPIVCTDNHKFLVIDKFTGCKWVEAHDLQVGDIIYSHPGINYVTVLKIEDVVYNKAVPYYDIVDSGEYSNYFINAGSEDICVHNSGKSLFMMSEAISAIKQGKKVVYAAIGDLKQFDFASRICAMILQIPISKVAINLPNYFKMVNNLFPELKKNMTVQFISPNKYTAEEWLKMNEQSGLIKDSDVFFIDYDTNFASEKDSMYAKGDEVYTMAFVLSQKPGGKYVFIGSQPKVGNWRDDKLGLETASESSRKQQIIDVMVTISVDKDVRNVRNHLGVINVPKNRRGGMTSFDYFLDPTGLMVPITQEARNVIKMDTSIVSVIESKNYDITTHLIPNARKYKSDSELVEGEEYLALPAEDAN